MKKLLIYCFLLAGIFTSCEDIYSPKIDQVENVIVVDARIVNGGTNNSIKIYESRGFNEKDGRFSGIQGASVTVIASNNVEVKLSESEDGIFPANFQFNHDLSYQLKIELNGETYESNFENVPLVPSIDTVYGISEIKYVKGDGNNNVNDIREKPGVQLYADIRNEKDSPYFRFTSRKILQYTYPVEVMMMGTVMLETMYGWYSYYPQESFNIAAPAEYTNSTEIVKHPLYFLEQKAARDPSQSFAGWILILYQHGLSKSGYNYYKDLNNQLIAEGRLFDPVYVQARNNLKCTTSPDKIILGNFEISTTSETRYFVRFISDEKGYYIRRIPYFYEISEQGEQLSNQPDFWEYSTKQYPDD